jgi:hypothetical protein
MSTVTRDIVRLTLVRSLYVAAAFTATLFVFVIAGQTPERSLWEWVMLGSVLALLALLGGLLATFIELRER